MDNTVRQALTSNLAVVRVLGMIMAPKLRWHEELATS
jgi:hypothetical protein